MGCMRPHALDCAEAPAACMQDALSRGNGPGGVNECAEMAHPVHWRAGAAGLATGWRPLAGPGPACTTPHHDASAGHGLGACLLTACDSMLMRVCSTHAPLICIILALTPLHHSRRTTSRTFRLCNPAHWQQQLRGVAFSAEGHIVCYSVAARSVVTEQRSATGACERWKGAW